MCADGLSRIKESIAVAYPDTEYQPSYTALLNALYLATFEATKKWTMPLRNRGKVYGELSIMYNGRLE